MGIALHLGQRFGAGGGEGARARELGGELVEGGRQGDGAGGRDRVVI